MTEDDRMARNSEEPPKAGPYGAARWSDYLDWVRSDAGQVIVERTGYAPLPADKRSGTGSK